MHVFMSTCGCVLVSTCVSVCFYIREAAWYGDSKVYNLLTQPKKKLE